MEERFNKGNTKAAWQNLNMMMGKAQVSARMQCQDPNSFVEPLNTFYARFNVSRVAEVWDQTTDSNAPTPISVKEQKVISILSRLQPRKASGPDGLERRILKECSAQLKGMVAELSQLSLNTGYVPKAWKETIIIPVPKKPNAKEMENF